MGERISNFNGVVQGLPPTSTDALSKATGKAGGRKYTEGGVGKSPEQKLLSKNEKTTYENSILSTAKKIVLTKSPKLKDLKAFFDDTIHPKGDVSSKNAPIQKREPPPLPPRELKKEPPPLPPRDPVTAKQTPSLQSSAQKKEPPPLPPRELKPGIALTEGSKAVGTPQLTGKTDDPWFKFTRQSEELIGQSHLKNAKIELHLMKKYLTANDKTLLPDQKEKIQKFIGLMEKVVKFDQKISDEISKNSDLKNPQNMGDAVIKLFGPQSSEYADWLVSISELTEAKGGVEKILVTDQNYESFVKSSIRSSEWKNDFKNSAWTVFSNPDKSTIFFQRQMRVETLFSEMKKSVPQEATLTGIQLKNTSENVTLMTKMAQMRVDIEGLKTIQSLATNPEGLDSLSFDEVMNLMQKLNPHQTKLLPELKKHPDIQKVIGMEELKFDELDKGFKVLQVKSLLKINEELKPLEKQIKSVKPKDRTFEEEKDFAINVKAMGTYLSKLRKEDLNTPNTVKALNVTNDMQQNLLKYLQKTQQWERTI